MKGPGDLWKLSSKFYEVNQQSQGKVNGKQPLSSRNFLNVF